MPVLGKIGLVNRGTYSASASYTALDFVLYNGSSYVALKSVKGVTPTNDRTNWQTLVHRQQQLTVKAMLPTMAM